MANVIIEFLDSEVLENAITCMHYQFDKVVLLGYHENIDKYKNVTINFLVKHCDLKKHDIVFHEMSHTSIESVTKILREVIDSEIALKNDVYLDITGGESLILLAFGMISNEYNLPMHVYNVHKDSVMVLNEKSKKRITNDVNKRDLVYSIEMLLELRGGAINPEKLKDYKQVDTSEYRRDIFAIYNIAAINHKTTWTHFVILCKEIKNDENPLFIKTTGLTVKKKLDEMEGIKAKEVYAILEELAEQGLVSEVIHSNGVFQFRIKNDLVRDCLLDEGSYLELYTTIKFRDRADIDECITGAMIDWDGVIHKSGDVENEIDVLCRQGNHLLFISCKTGRMRRAGEVSAELYKLKCVSERFGGKYAKAELVASQEIGDVDKERAKEMDIALTWY